MDEGACRKRLTTYEAHSIRKLAPQNPKEKSTWGRAEIVKEPLLSDEIAKEVKALGEESKKTVSDKKAALYPYQQAQVNKLLDDLTNNETDPYFEWSLAQIHRKERHAKHEKPETILITVYVKRGVKDNVSAVAIYQALERHKAERMAALNRPPSIMPQSTMTKSGTGTALTPQFVQLSSKDKPTIVHRASTRKGARSRASDVSSDFYSDSDSDSYESSYGTTVSSRSARKSRHYSHGRAHRSRSHDRVREHIKTYYVTDRAHSPPRPRERWHSPPPRRYASSTREAPRPTVPVIDPVSAAYIAGKVDADAERLERLDRYPPPTRIERSIEPRAIISYDRPDRYRNYHYEELPRRYVDERRYDDRRLEDRFVDRYYDDVRARSGYNPTREELRSRAAEDYMNPRLPPRVVHDHPFAPRGPLGTSSAGW